MMLCSSSAREVRDDRSHHGHPRWWGGGELDGTAPTNAGRKHPVFLPRDCRTVATHDHRHIPAFLGSEDAGRADHHHHPRAAGSHPAASFDRVPLDVDKKVFCGGRDSGRIMLYQWPPPPSLTAKPRDAGAMVSSPAAVVVEDDDHPEQRMPQSTLQVLETLLLDGNNEEESP